jgi:hypothetical protein
MKHASLVIAALGAALIAGGCGSQGNPIGLTGNSQPAGVRALVAAGAQLDSAFLELCVRVPGGELVIVHPVDQSWLESTVTWNTIGPWVSPFVIRTFAATDSGMVRVNVSTLVNGWLVGTRVNNGIMLDQNPPYIERTQFDSREKGATCPRLQLYFSDADSTFTWTLRTVGDAYVDENRPATNMGFDTALYSGYETGMPGEDRTLLAFDLSEPVAYAALGDRVWDDLDGNGNQDAGEPGMPGVTVNLYDCFGAPVASKTTDANGNYLFDSLVTGAYRLEVIAPAGFVFSPRGVGTDSLTDSDVDPATGQTDCFAAMEASMDLEWDAGLYLPTAPEPGCTHGLGYWKNRAGFGKQGDSVSTHLPIWLGTPGGAKSIDVSTAEVAHDILGMLAYGHPSNGITKLYAGLLVTRLNIGAGAAPEEIQPVLDEIDAFLADSGWQDWDALGNGERQQIAHWRMELNRYNGGAIGPGSCDEESDD